MYIIVTSSSVSLVLGTETPVSHAWANTHRHIRVSKSEEQAFGGVCQDSGGAGTAYLSLGMCVLADMHDGVRRVRQHESRNVEEISIADSGLHGR